MAEILEQLRRIADIVGESSVAASYTQHTLGNSRDGYRPGWKVEVNGVYKGAVVSFYRVAATLDEAAGAALKQLKEALGLH
jgi:hypothetical protein